MEDLTLYIEALIFSAQQAITLEEIKLCLEKTLEISLSTTDLQERIQQIKQKYAPEAHFAFELVLIGNGYQFLTRPTYHKAIAVLMNHKAKRRLSTAAMETLAVVAYKQPVTKTEIEHLRGVNCDYSVQKLLEKELIEIKGRSELPGKPLLYGTTNSFMDYFGINSTEELPKLKDIQPDANAIGSLEKEN